VVGRRKHACWLIFLQAWTEQQCPGCLGLSDPEILWRAERLQVDLAGILLWKCQFFAGLGIRDVSEGKKGMLRMGGSI
jgi:hypothetical protein